MQTIGKEVVFLAEPPFQSFQGEGKNQGKNSLFIRFFGCNLRCDFCDTKYSWGEDEKKKVEMDKNDLISLIRNYSHIIFTGGEPLLLRNLFVLLEIFEKYKKEKSFEIETNASLYNSNFFDIVFDMKNELDLLFTLSPKINVEQKVTYNSIIKENYKNNVGHFMRDFLKKIKMLPNTSKIDYIVKFILGKDEDKDIILDFQKTYNIPSQKIYIQNIGTSEGQIKHLYKKYEDWILKNGYNYSIRQYIFLKIK